MSLSWFDRFDRPETRRREPAEPRWHDTQPVWFRSEGFAEDLAGADGETPAQPEAARCRPGVDARGRTPAAVRPARGSGAPGSPLGPRDPASLAAQHLLSVTRRMLQLG